MLEVIAMNALCCCHPIMQNEGHYKSNHLQEPSRVALGHHISAIAVVRKTVWRKAIANLSNMDVIKGASVHASVVFVEITLSLPLLYVSRY